MKTSLKKIAAVIAAAAMMAVSVPAITASAASSSSFSQTYMYYSSVTKLYYSTYAEALAASGSSSLVYEGNQYIGMYSSVFSEKYPYYNSSTKLYYPTLVAAAAATSGNASYVEYKGTSGVNKYVVDTSKTYSATFPYFSSYTGLYYRTFAEAYAASNGNSSLVSSGTTVEISSSSSNYAGYPYYSSYTKRYYQTYSAALAASNNDPSYITTYYNGTTYYGYGYGYYSTKTNKYYNTYSEALAASNYDATMVITGTNYYYSPYYYDYYYYSPYYYYGPYYYTTTYRPVIKTSVSYTTVKEGDGTPCINGSTKGGSDYIAYVIKNTSSKNTVVVDMNGSSTVDSTVLSALKGRNVNVKFILPDATVTVNGTSVKATDSVNLGTEVTKGQISEKLLSKATKGAVSSAGVAIGNGSAWNFNATVGVKFSTKRANDYAKIYRYDSEKNSLVLVSRQLVNGKGVVSFDTSKGGQYLIVISE